MSATGSACNWSTRTWSGGTSTSRGSIEVTPSIGFESDGDAGVGRGKRMADKRKIALFAGGGLFAILLLTVVALLLFLDVNAHKPRLEALASDALGMEVRIGGRMGIGLFSGFHVTLEGGRIRDRGGRRRLREVDHPRDRTSPPPPQGTPDRKDRDEAPPDLHRAGPRRKIQLRNTGGGSREENGRGGRRNAILPGRDENIPLGRRPLLRGQKNRGRARGRGLQPGCEPPSVHRREEVGPPEEPFLFGGIRLQGVPQGELGGLEPETPDRGEGRAVRDSPRHRGPARLLRLRRESDGGSARPGRGKPRRRGRRKGRPSPEDFLFGDRRDRGGPGTGPRRLRPEVRRGREGWRPRAPSGYDAPLRRGGVGEPPGGLF